MKDLKTIDLKKCTICATKFEIESGLQGFFGIIPVVFCEFCFKCILELADQVNPNNKLT